MLIGASTSNKLQLVTSATADIEVDLHVIAVSDASPPVVQGTEFLSDPLPSITGATTTDLLAGAANRVKRVDYLTIRNNHGSTTCDVTVRHVDGTDTVDLIKATLLAGEALIYNRAGTWLHYDTNSALYPNIGVAASQTDQETATATTKYVAPGTQHFHPSAAKCWGKATVAAGTPTLAVSYNITSITDTATDQLTVTTGNDFSSANYSCQVSIEAATTTLSATTTSLLVFVRNATLLAGSFIIQACEIDVGAATDPSSWSWVCFGDL